MVRCHDPAWVLCNPVSCPLHICNLHGLGVLGVKLLLLGPLEPLLLHNICRRGGGLTPFQVPAGVTGSVGNSVPDFGGVPCEDPRNSGTGSGGVPIDNDAPGDGREPLENLPLALDGQEAPLPDPQQVSVNRDPLNVG